MYDESGWSRLVQAGIELRSSVVCWDDFFLRAATEHYEAQRQVGGSASRSAQGLDVRRFRSAREVLLLGLQRLHVGAEVDVKSLLVPAAQLVTSLQAAKRWAEPHASHAAALSTLLEEFIESAEALGEADRESQLFPNGSSNARQLDPPNDSGTSAGVTEDITATRALKDCVNWLAAQSKQAIDSSWLLSLQDLISAMADSEAARENQAAGRSLVDLVDRISLAVTDSLHQRSPVSAALCEKLRRILTDFFHYQILDRDLIGLPLCKLRDRVRIHSVCSSPTLPSDHVVSIYRPGYLLQISNGNSPIVVRLAEVNVSK